MRIHGSIPFLFFCSLFPIVAMLTGTSTRASAPPQPGIEITVSATRLDDRDLPLEEIPASITVITRERIEASGARHLQDLLSLEAGAIVYDQVGNDVQKTFDLRGFAGGTGCAIYLDGARLNDPRSNAAALADIPLEAVERIEIVRGSSAALAGGGSEAGVVRIVTRRAISPVGAFTLATGSDSARQFGGEAGSRFGRFDAFVSAASDRTDGFRTNAGGEQRRWAAKGGVDLGEGRRLALSVVSSRLDIGHPGALTQSEFDSRRESADYNRLDFTDARRRSAVVNFRGPLPRAWSLAANLSWISSAAETLSTGRAAAAGFGGFFLDAEGTTRGSTVQLTRDTASRSGVGHHLAFGVEWLDGETESLGWFTDPADPGSFERENPDSDNLAARRTLAIFAQETWRPSSRWSLSAGARWDADRTAYRERRPDPASSEKTRFSELSLRAGAVYHAGARLDLFASYGESFLPPTVEELFAFPLFGSNRELRPEDANTVEVGLRSRGGAVAVETTLFRVTTSDEIVFDPDAGPGLFGTNVNAGRTRRTGAEVALDGRAGERVGWFVRYTRTQAEFLTGRARGKRVPLVPADRASAGVDVALRAGVALHADALFCGDQALDNDDANAQRGIDPYRVVNTRLSWNRGGRGRPAVPPADRVRDGLTLFVEVRNLFDESYATRGIWAYDFLAGANAVFLTPAPGRRLFGGATWRY